MTKAFKKSQLNMAIDVAIVASFAVATSLHAQTQAPASPAPATENAAQPVQTITITTRRELIERFNNAGSMVIVTRQDIENLGADSVADVMKNLPGVQVTTGSDGSAVVRMRGMDASATQILVDGQRSAAGRGQVPLDQMPPEMIERIEVLRAPSAQFSGASGGTINIILRQANVRRESAVRLGLQHARNRTQGQLFFFRTGALDATAFDIMGDIRRAQARGAALAAMPTVTSGAGQRPALGAGTAAGGAPGAAEATNRPARPMPQRPIPVRPPAGAPGAPGAGGPGGSPAGDLMSANEPSEGTSSSPNLPALPEGSGPVWSYLLMTAVGGMPVGNNTHRDAVQNDTVNTLGVTDSESEHTRRYWSISPRITGRLSSKDQITFRTQFNKSSFNGAITTASSGNNPNGSTYNLSSTEFVRSSRSYAQGAIDWNRRLEGYRIESSFMGSRAADENRRSGSQLNLLTNTSGNSGYEANLSDQLWTLQTKIINTESQLLRQGGAELSTRSLNSDVTLLGGVPSVREVDTRRAVVWGQNEWGLGKDTTLNAGLRLENHHFEVKDPAAPVDRSWTIAQPSLHTRTKLDAQHQLRLNVSRFLRLPSINDLNSQTLPSTGSNSLSNPDTLGNAALKPETTWTLDMGIDRRLGTQGTAGMNVFYRRVTDQIAPQISLIGGRWVEQKTNLGQARVWGVEFDVKNSLVWAGFPSTWQISSNLSLLGSEVDDGLNLKQRIPGQARYIANINIANPMRRTGGYFGGVTLNATGQAQLKTTALVSGKERPKANLEMHIGHVWPRVGMLRFAVSNLTNTATVRDREYLVNGGVQRETSTTKSGRRFNISYGAQF
jgi:outer membrane receptor for ferrienterochelin and colicins